MPLELEIEGGLIIDAGGGVEVGIYAGAVAPNVSGVAASNGSVFLTTGGVTFRKNGPGNLDWSVDQVAAGSVPGTTPVTVSGTLGGANTLVLISTLTSSIIVTLPTAASVPLKFYHLKWLASAGGGRRVDVVVAGGGTIEGVTSLRIAKVGDSLNCVSTGTTWILI